MGARIGLGHTSARNTADDMVTMRTRHRKRLMIALALLMPAACLSASLGSGSDAAWAQAGGVMTVKLDDQDWTANRIKLSLSGQSGYSTLTLSAYLDGARTEVLRLGLRMFDGDKPEQTYKLTRWCSTLSGGLSLDTLADNIDEVRHALVSGEVTIKRFDHAARTVSGTFSGTVRNYTGTRTISLNDGHFAAVMPPVVIGTLGGRPLVKPCRPTDSKP
jgi:hypothetical protein